MGAAEFDDCEVSVASGITILRRDPPDTGAALAGLIQRLAARRLEVVQVPRVTSTPEG